MLVAYFVVLNGTYLLLTVLAAVQMRREVLSREYLGLDEVLRSPLTPGISVLVPHNEEAVIVESVRSPAVAATPSARSRRHQ